MKISEAIKRLTALQKRYGDLDIHLASDDEYGWGEPEFSGITRARVSRRSEERATGEDCRFVILEVEQ